ncbi:MAG TPA: response regulator [Dehalococcoidia bacterium]|nr:response regulator [Dehalococcoidia bacterium]
MAESPRILLIDDEPNILETGRRVLERAGYQVCALDSAQAALDLMRAERLDAVVTDIMMPELSGVDLIEHIHDMLPDAAVVVMTGYGTDEVRAEMAGRGAREFLAKPFTPTELRTAVARALGR